MVFFSQNEFVQKCLNAELRFGLEFSLCFGFRGVLGRDVGGPGGWGEVWCKVMDFAL